ncbi:UNKNOWN [Stylonychia lemnae]|uniref:Glucosyltransferase 24 catalytic domain-containing protein n=1 Tax=Stylonychia lemnae TaxID=5949 RepID=A0A077ZU51_STYLE|nr:UNKNOWN [Stylonychia lemnae]|eukprot:CDW73104.1 UNKNOWN [Stylonychia lemnae]
MYRIMFSDQIFDHKIQRIIYKDSDQCINPGADFQELRDFNLEGHPLGQCQHGDDLSWILNWTRSLKESNPQLVLQNIYHFAAIIIKDLQLLHNNDHLDKAREYYNESLKKEQLTFKLNDQHFIHFSQHLMPIKSIPWYWIFSHWIYGYEPIRKAKNIDMYGSTKAAEALQQRTTKFQAAQVFCIGFEQRYYELTRHLGYDLVDIELLETSKMVVFHDNPALVLKLPFDYSLTHLQITEKLIYSAIQEIKNQKISLDQLHTIYDFTLSFLDTVNPNQSVVLQYKKFDEIIYLTSSELKFEGKGLLQISELKDFIDQSLYVQGLISDFEIILKIQQPKTFLGGIKGVILEVQNISYSIVEFNSDNQIILEDLNLKKELERQIYLMIKRQVLAADWHSYIHQKKESNHKLKETYINEKGEFFLDRPLGLPERRTRFTKSKLYDILDGEVENQTNLSKALILKIGSSENLIPESINSFIQNQSFFMQNNSDILMQVFMNKKPGLLKSYTNSLQKLISNVSNNIKKLIAQAERASLLKNIEMQKKNQKQMSNDAQNNQNQQSDLNDQELQILQQIGGIFTTHNLQKLIPNITQLYPDPKKVKLQLSLDEKEIISDSSSSQQLEDHYILSQILVKLQIRFEKNPGYWSQLRNYNFEIKLVVYPQDISTNIHPDLMRFELAYLTVDQSKIINQEETDYVKQLLINELQIWNKNFDQKYLIDPISIIKDFLKLDYLQLQMHDVGEAISIDVLGKRRANCSEALTLQILQLLTEFDILSGENQIDIEAIYRETYNDCEDSQDDANSLSQIQGLFKDFQLIEQKIQSDETQQYIQKIIVDFLFNKQEYSYAQLEKLFQKKKKFTKESQIIINAQN